MTQRLILPINKCTVTASFKAEAYKARFGFSHYGADMVSFSGQNTVYASGKGSVLATGWDNVVGNVIIVRYDGAINHKTGQAPDVIARYFHLKEILVTPGKHVDSDTILAAYGNTGKYSAGAHLHVEFDANTLEPRKSKTLGGSSNLILAAENDTMIDPLELLHCKAEPPDSQEIRADKSTYNGKFYADPKWTDIPKI